jgi:hypothetical protein
MSWVPVEALDDGVDDPEGHRVEGAGHRLDLARRVVGALQHVLPRQLEVARGGATSGAKRTGLGG